MSDLNGQTGELRAVITVTRKATGKVETYELVGRTTPEQHSAIVHGAHGAIVGEGSEINKSSEDK